MAECRTFEELLQGPDGQPDKAIRPKLEEVVSEAKGEDVERVEVECRVTPAGTATASRQEWTSSFGVGDPLESVIEAIRRKLDQSPGEAFSGQIRLNFRAFGNSAQGFGSFTRTFRPGISAEVGTVAGVPLSGDIAQASAVYMGMIKPMADLQIRQLDAAATLVTAAAQLVKAQHPPPLTGKGAIVGDLLKGVVGAASAGGGAAGGNQAAQPAVPVAVGTWNTADLPPGPPGMPRQEVSRPPAPPTPGQANAGTTGQQAHQPPPQLGQRAELTADDVEAWLMNNQADALRIGNKALDRFGFVAVPKGAA